MHARRRAGAAFHAERAAGNPRGGFQSPSRRLALAVAVLAPFLLVGPAAAPSPGPAAGPGTPTAIAAAVSPAGGSTQQYVAPVHAVANATPSKLNLTNAAAAWFPGAGARTASISLGNLPVGRLSWNGTATAALGGQIEFTTGTQLVASTCTASAGTVWANLTATPIAGGSPTTYGWSTKAAGGSHSVGFGCPVNSVHVAPSWAIAAPSNETLSLVLAVSAATGDTFANTLPVGAVTVATGVAGVNAYSSLGVGAAGAIPFDWGWSWILDPFQGTSFANVPGATITWASFYSANASYNGVKQGPGTSGTYTDTPVASAVGFQGSPLDPAFLYSFSVTFTVTNNALPGVFATVNYTTGAGHHTGQLAATEVIPYNLTWSLLEFTFSAPFNLSGYLSVKGGVGWVFGSAYPPGFVYAAANNTVAWSPAPLEFQVTFLAPSPGGTGILTIAYAPTSPLFSFLGSTIPFGSVETFVDGQFQPSATFPVVIGNTYVVQTQDAFGDVLLTTNVTVSVPDQVSLLRVAIWPLSVVDLNSSFVIGLAFRANGITQQAPDLTPLETQVLYLPAATYRVTLDYLEFGTGAIAQVVSVPLTVAGVGFYVVTGTTLTDIQVLQENATSLIERVNVTFAQGTGALLNQTLHLSYNVSTIAGALPFRLEPGTPSLAGGTYTVPVFLLNDTGALANASDVRQAWQGLSVDYVSPTGIVPLNWSFVAQGPGQFSIALRLTSAQTAAVSNGTSVVALTAPIQVGAITDVATGEIGGATLAAVGRAAGWWSDLGIPNAPPSGCVCTADGIYLDFVWFASSEAGRAIYLLGAALTLLYAWRERELLVAKRRKKEAGRR